MQVMKTPVLSITLAELVILSKVMSILNLKISA